jgi:trans-aconitate 2-methyltransferase
MEWNPAQYLKFDKQRTQPALDLLARVPAGLGGHRGAGLRITDLGCGPGTITRVLHERWPKAYLTGVDGSGEMLSVARATDELRGVEWHEADITKWTPVDPPHLIFSNAVFHWLDHHDEILPRLLGSLADGGVLAVQMAANHAAPSHTAIFDLAESRPWARQLEPLVRRRPLAEPEAYYDMLAAAANTLEIWTTEYLYLLEGENPIVEWVKGSVLKPFLDALNSDQQIAFLEQYDNAVRAAYPQQSDGRTLFPFRRFFVLCVR